jgi:TRAP-type C4-dicarboxylate transport system permease small subunit
VPASPTREHKHINVDALGRLFRGKARRWLQLFINCFSLFIVILLMLAARDFVLMEREFATEISHGVPAWIVELILPFGFLLIAIRLVLDSILLFAPQKEADNNA